MTEENITSADANSTNCCDEDSRRKFIVVSTLAVSAVCGVFPFAAGVTTILDPVKKSAGDKEKVPWTKVVPLASLSEDGKPAKYEIILEQVQDAWTTYKNVPAGAVYLTRKGEGVTAFNLKCPHLGCAVDYRSKSNDYFCPCHNSTFGLDGSVTDVKSPSPRGLDTMDTKVEGGFVWIRFQQFRPNIVEKVPLS
ncbi:MAG: ubiquinol-cytochrome c reductase iron-sulfur subunit [Opitutae bacterium]|jgi:menaquinol-cytochrome c reductase iron-sulfur subunit|nr:ubiquinol-cytochrome c reductase iron-sulfur subunit [Opitutae bacterium]MBT5716360.1 ubiquinol-cytochrome c reductase iron-sulfur subunit [Opitutae bacterium]